MAKKNKTQKVRLDDIEADFKKLKGICLSANSRLAKRLNLLEILLNHNSKTINELESRVVEFEHTKCCKGE